MMLTRRYFPIIFCANVAVLAAILPKLIDSARGGLLLLVVVVFIAASLATLFVMGLAREARLGRRVVPVPPRADALEERADPSASQRVEDLREDAFGVETLSVITQRVLADANGPLAQWRPASVSVPARQQAWVRSVVQSYQLFIMTRLAEGEWGREPAHRLDAAFEQHLEAADLGDAATYRLLRELLEQGAPGLLDEDVSMLATIERCLAVDILEDDARSEYRLDRRARSRDDPPLEFGGLDVALVRCLGHGRAVATRAFELVLESADVPAEGA